MSAGGDRCDARGVRGDSWSSLQGRANGRSHRRGRTQTLTAIPRGWPGDPEIVTRFDRGDGNRADVATALVSSKRPPRASAQAACFGWVSSISCASVHALSPRGRLQPHRGAAATFTREVRPMMVPLCTAPRFSVRSSRSSGGGGAASIPGPHLQASAFPRRAGAVDRAVRCTSWGGDPPTGFPPLRPGAAAGRAFLLGFGAPRGGRTSGPRQPLRGVGARARPAIARGKKASEQHTASRSERPRFGSCSAR